MRKKTIYVLATVMCMSIFTACGSTNRADAGNEVQQEVQLSLIHISEPTRH